MNKDAENNLIAAGAVFMALHQSSGRGLAAEIVVDSDGNVTNQIEIRLDFMRSPYRLTVERVAP